MISPFLTLAAATMLVVVAVCVDAVAVTFAVKQALVNGNEASKVSFDDAHSVLQLCAFIALPIALLTSAILSAMKRHLITFEGAAAVACAADALATPLPPSCEVAAAARAAGVTNTAWTANPDNHSANNKNNGGGGNCNRNNNSFASALTDAGAYSVDAVSKRDLAMSTAIVRSTRQPATNALGYAIDYSENNEKNAAAESMYRFAPPFDRTATASPAAASNANGANDVAGGGVQTRIVPPPRPFGAFDGVALTDYQKRHILQQQTYQSQLHWQLNALKTRHYQQQQLLAYQVG
jgi:hypothetical protein